MQPKKKMVISLENASREVLEAIAKKYPEGWQNYVIKVDLGPEKSFHAITVDIENVSYLVKVPVKIDTKIEEEIEKDNYSFLSDSDDSEEESSDGESDDGGSSSDSDGD